MWVSLIKREAALSRKVFERQTPRTFHSSSSRFVHSASSLLFQPTFPMATNTSPPVEWSAPRVRETFLNFFKENGHTFGEWIIFISLPPTISDSCAPRLPLVPLGPSSMFFEDLYIYISIILWIMANRALFFHSSSPLLGCCASVRSYSSLHQCWYEPVQVHLPRHRGPAVRLCKVAQCCQFAKGRQCLDIFCDEHLALTLLSSVSVPVANIMWVGGIRNRQTLPYPFQLVDRLLLFRIWMMWARTVTTMWVSWVSVFWIVYLPRYD